MGVGKSGNPDTMNITPGLIVSPNTDILSVEGMIVTPGFVEIHAHFDRCSNSTSTRAGFTTVIGGGTGPKTVGIECPGVFNLHRMLEAMARFRSISAISERVTPRKGALRAIVIGGATGLKIHEDWSSSPAVIGHAWISPTNSTSRSRSTLTR